MELYKATVIIYGIRTEGQDSTYSTMVAATTEKDAKAQADAWADERALGLSRSDAWVEPVELPEGYEIVRGNRINALERVLAAARRYRKMGTGAASQTALYAALDDYDQKAREHGEASDTALGGDGGDH